MVVASALPSSAFAAEGAHPWFNCALRQSGPGERFCHDARIVQNAWFVFKPYGSFHLAAGKYVSPRSGLIIRLLNRPGLLAVEGNRAIALATVHPRNKDVRLYASLMIRTSNGFFFNTATTLVGTRVRPLNLTLHGDRLRISIVQRNGRQATQIYHVTNRSLTAAATRHAQ